MGEGRFDDLIHAPHRLRICAMLSQAEGIEFGEVLRRMALTKSALSKHVSQLAAAGYVSDIPIVRQGRSRQLLSLTPAGLAAYHGHRAALQRLLDDDASAADDGALGSAPDAGAAPNVSPAGAEY